MAGFFESLYDKASQLVNDTKEAALECYKAAEEYVSSVGNATRLVVNSIKHPCNAIATATLNGAGELIKSVKTGAVNLCDEAADWAKPLAKCGKFLQKYSPYLKALSIGEAAYEAIAEHKSKKSWEVGCSMALGAGAAMGATALLAATPIGWAAAGVFVAGAAGAWGGDWIGSRIGDLCDNNNQTIPKENIQPKPPQPAEEIRKAEPAIPLEIRKALMPNEDFKDANLKTSVPATKIYDSSKEVLVKSF